MDAQAGFAVGLQLDDAFLDALADRMIERVGARGGGTGRHASDNRWLNSREAVVYLGLPSLHALHKLTAGRHVPFVQERPGARCWFRRSDLDGWREAHQLGPGNFGAVR